MRAPGIRAATFNDIEAIRSLGADVWREVYSTLLPEGYIESALAQWWSSEHFQNAITDSNQIVLVAESATELIGVAQTAILQPTEAMLWKLYVRSGWRNKGLGRRMIEETIRRLPPEVAVLRTEYYAANERAGMFYRKLGFVFDFIEESSYQGQKVRSAYLRLALPSDR